MVVEAVEKEEHKDLTEMVDVAVIDTKLEDVVALQDVMVEIVMLDIEETVEDVAKTIVVDGQHAVHKTGHVETVKVAITPLVELEVLVEQVV
jgi:hypothetical protein